MSKKLIIDWDTYNKSIDKLALQINDSGYSPSFIICIARGGLRVGDILSRIFNVKCGYLGVESYSAKKKNQIANTQNELTFARDLSTLRQIGRWSAEMILLFTFNRSNIWPVQDIGLLRAISNNYKKKYHPPKNFVENLNKKFTPYCTVATWYLWRSIDDEPIQY